MSETEVSRLRGSRTGRWGLVAASPLVTVTLAALAARHVARSPWPLSGARPGLVVVAAGLLLLITEALKALGWRRLFSGAERPSTLALPAGNGGRGSASSFRVGSTT